MGKRRTELTGEQIIAAAIIAPCREQIAAYLADGKWRTITEISLAINRNRTTTRNAVRVMALESRTVVYPLGRVSVYRLDQAPQRVKVGGGDRRSAREPLVDRGTSNAARSGNVGRGKASDPYAS